MFYGLHSYVFAYGISMITLLQFENKNLFGRYKILVLSKFKRQVLKRQR